MILDQHCLQHHSQPSWCMCLSYGTSWCVQHAETKFSMVVFTCLASHCEDQAAWWLQVVNLVTNRVSRILGKVENTERFLRVALYQGIPKQGIKTQRQLATTESSRAVTRQPTLLCTAFNKQRLYLFTTQEPDDSDHASTSRCNFALLTISSPTHPFAHPVVAIPL